MADGTTFPQRKILIPQYHNDQVSKKDNDENRPVLFKYVDCSS